jgi:diguanylate cyclase (GGDEF)-like protein
VKSTPPRTAAPIDPPIADPKESRDFRCWGTARLRLLFLGPLATITIIIVLSLSILQYQQEKNALQQGVVRIHASAQDFYEESVRYDAQVLQAIMHSLGHDTILRAALAQRDRGALLQHAAPLFADLRRDFNITHFYFTGPDRVNLLRVHTPLRYGDVIDRITTLQAESSGEIAYGVELGPLGTFTLRLVSPWYDEPSHKLIGYVELGMELDQVLNKLEEFFGLQVITTVYKSFLQRDTWEAGMRALGRTPHWDRFPNIVVSERSTKKIPPLMAEHLMRDEVMTKSMSMELTKGGFTYQMIHLPLHDAGGREVAQMVLLADVTLAVNKMRETLYIGSLAMLSAGLILFIIFYWLVGKIGRRIEYDERELQNLAIRDGLTGLYNHRTFYSLLEDELQRSQRHTRPISLLMLDIDHFKRVNDTYGHQAGDLILHGLGDLLMQQARAADRVCRYGGEEIILILSETDTEIAINIAERIRKTVEAHVFVIPDEKSVSITVSVGVAVYPEDANTKEALVAAVDAAMYQAKETGRNRVCAHALST